MRLVGYALLISFPKWPNGQSFRPLWTLRQAVAEHPKWPATRSKVAPWRIESGLTAGIGPTGRKAVNNYPKPRLYLPFIRGSGDPRRMRREMGGGV